MDYQRITAFLIGNATRDGELKKARETGNPYGQFRLAVRSKDDQTIYYPVYCFGGLANGVTGIKKGTKVFVDGDLEIASLTEGDGETRMTFRVTANTYRILAQPRGSSQQGRGGRSRSLHPLAPKTLCVLAIGEASAAQLR